MYVDRHTLTGSVNNFSMQTLFTGSLAASQCALQLGGGTSFSRFRGYMDDITVYLCRPGNTTTASGVTTPKYVTLTSTASISTTPKYVTPKSNASMVTTPTYVTPTLSPTTGTLAPTTGTLAPTTGTPTRSSLHLTTTPQTTAERVTPTLMRVTTTPSAVTMTPSSSSPSPQVTTAPWDHAGMCDNCIMVNGVGYKAHWAQCDLFIQCHFLPDGSARGGVLQCPHGLHWNHRALTCTRPAQAACAMDRCLHPREGLYPATNNCRGYWVCEGDRSQGKCCPEGHSYGGRIGCVVDPQCHDLCGVSPTEPPACDKRAVPQSPLTFEQYVPGAGWTLMFCAPGTAYNHSHCACTDFRPNARVPNSCRAELYLPFKGDVKDESGNNNFVQNEGVKVVNGAGYFDGRALLRVPRFANADYGDYLLIRLRYKQEAGGAGGRQALVANGDCLKPSSLYMAADQQGVAFGSLTSAGGKVAVHVPSTTGGWKEAVMYVDRHTLTGSVNDFSMQTLFTGSLASSQCSLQFGSGTSFSHFTGYMDDLTASIVSI